MCLFAGIFFGLGLLFYGMSIHAAQPDVLQLMALGCVIIGAFPLRVAGLSALNRIGKK